MKKAFITGIAGQDGSYLAELLLSNGYEVHGLVRQKSGHQNLTEVLSKINLHVGDVVDEAQITGLIESIRPDEIYHLATRHEVNISTEDYIKTHKVDTESTMFVLMAIANHVPKAKFFYASSSNVFGEVKSSPQNEDYAMNPTTIYSISKASGMRLVRMFREKKNVFACSGILFNHESPRRDAFFLPRKITSTAAKIKLGLESQLILGNIESRRDWGYAGDVASAMWLILQAQRPTDYVIGTGKTHSVRELLDIAFNKLDLDWKKYVHVSPELMRPVEKHEIVADISKIKNELKWAPQKDFKSLIEDMVESDLKLFKNPEK